jgi:methyltransferase (TIGR00027 family)
MNGEPTETAGMGPVNWTAVSVARVRAAESARPDRLIEDPWAAALAADVGQPPSSPVSDPAAESLRGALRHHVVIRTRFYDEVLLDACTDGLRQVVLLGAGLDTRAYRLPWPTGVRAFEVDVAAVLARKDETMLRLGVMPRCVRKAVPTDLRGDWAAALSAAGFQSTVPTAWLLEGLLIYLDADEATRLLGELDLLSAPGSRLATEAGTSANTTAGSGPQARTTGVRSLWRGGAGPGLVPWLEEHDWSCQVSRLDAVAASFGRPHDRPTSSGFITAARH